MGLIWNFINLISLDYDWISMNWIVIGLNWTVSLKWFEITFVGIYLNKNELNRTK